ncbi:terminase [Atlantibacter hermannii]|uniref:terminase n=1 Tax=Atlantibacter hermannii TaxID=565 RepID=UPI001C702BCC|nr:terminase [Atlantibacter hermannii]MBW9430730.1 terminase [Atlantibacter hermannii]
MSDDEEILEQQLVEDIASFTHDPHGYALYAFPWGEEGTELHDSPGPRQWQGEAFDEIGAHLQNPETRHQPLLISRASGHGIGKSAWISMLVKWGMDTCEDCKVVVTANTENQLRTKTWPEIAKWQRLSITKDWFNCTATAIYANDPAHAKSWRADAVPWSENNTEAFAGLHNKGKRIILIFDEASNIADLVWEVAEGALTDEGTEIIWVAFGNPTRNMGRFRECFRKYRHRWKGKQIDSRKVEGTNKEQIAKWEQDNGEDSDFFKVRVRGVFPDASETQFIPTGLTDAALARVVTERDVAHAPTIIGVDPAYSGADDAVIYMRKGLHAKLLWRGSKTTDDLIMAKRIADYEDEHQADAVHIDFGYGTGLHSIGSGWGRSWTLVPFGSASSDPQMARKRGEMFNNCKTWLKLGGALDERETAEDLSSAEYKVRVDGKIEMEPKEDIKKRLGRSPGCGDAFLLTFAFPVMKRQHALPGEKRGGAITEYDPYA